MKLAFFLSGSGSYECGYRHDRAGLIPLIDNRVEHQVEVDLSQGSAP
ncbi:MAG TPA: hypothetical protein VKA23_03660 [Mariprofundaceae bacterium]|nr:hypothetical protein [Mariprofundaceae bacterium]